MTLFTIGGVSVYAALATVWDLRERRIPNWLSGSAFLAALASAYADDGIGLWAAWSGAAVGLGALIIPFMLGAIGGGDVKFAAVSAAWLGPRLGVNALLLGSALGFFVALSSAAFAGRARETMQGTARLLWLAAATLSPTHIPRASTKAAPLGSIPYAVPLAGGVIMTVLLDQHGLLPL
jgi:prepilin peptidase CpaA